jgi:serine/threonine protein kinase
LFDQAGASIVWRGGTNLVMESGVLEAGQLIEDTYRITRRIGEGGMGEVYEATHARLSGRYAIKVLLREIAQDLGLLARFQREALVTSALRHPNIVQVLDFRQMPNGAPYIVMELLDGVDLANEIRRIGSLPLSRVASLVDQMASGLAAAHAQGVVHRDLKPANLFLIPLAGSHRELLKIVDFGISKVRASSARLTRTSTVIGTPQYMAPEQALAQADRIDARSDQFSFAAIVYEMVTGSSPFVGDSIPAIMYQLVHVEPPPMRSAGQPVAPAIEAVIRRGLAKSADARFPTVIDFAQAFEAASRQDAAGRPSASAPPAAGPGRRTLVLPNEQPTVEDVAIGGTRKIAVSSTTLRSTASEVVPVETREPRRSRRGLVLGVMALAITAAAGTAVSRLRPTNAGSVSTSAATRSADPSFPVPGAEATTPVLPDRPNRATWSSTWVTHLLV